MVEVIHPLQTGHQLVPGLEILSLNGQFKQDLDFSVLGSSITANVPDNVQTQRGVFDLVSCH